MVHARGAAAAGTQRRVVRVTAVKSGEGALVPFISPLVTKLEPSCAGLRTRYANYAATFKKKRYRVVYFLIIFFFFSRWHLRRW